MYKDIGLPGLEFGHTPSDLQDGKTIKTATQARPPASLSALPAKGKVKRMKDTFGQLGLISSPSDDLSRSLASKLAMVTDKLGSTLFSFKWSQWVTGSGALRFRLRAVARRTGGTDLSSWPTPQSADMSGGGQAKRAHEQGTSKNLNDFAMLAAWPTPNTPNGGRSQPAETTTTGKKPDGSKAQVCLENAVKLASWATPKSATGAYQYGKKREKLLNMEGQARLTAFGQTPNGCPVELRYPEQLSGGQLNAVHSRWLMGLPPIFCVCAIMASRSLKARKRGRSD